MENLNNANLAEMGNDYLACTENIDLFFETYPDNVLREKLWSFYRTRVLSVSTNALQPSADLLFFENLMDVLQYSKKALQQSRQLQHNIMASFEEHTLVSIEGLVDLIKQAIPVSLIYNLAHKKDELDLIIVLEKGCNKTFDEFESIIDLVTLGFKTGVCTIHNYNSLHYQINKGHVFYHTACIEKNIVYRKDNAEAFPIINKKIFEKTKMEAEILFKDSIDKAINFYCGAQYYINAGIYDMGMFMLQQACELTYRCLLNVLRGKDIKCHSPAVLRKHVRRFAPEIIGVFSSQEEQELNYLQLLEDAYIKSRYNQKYVIDYSMVQFLNERIGLLQDLAIDLFKDKIAILDDYIQHLEPNKTIFFKPLPNVMA